MNKYIVVAENGDDFYFATLADIAKFLGVTVGVVSIAFNFGDEIQGYTIDEVIQ